MRTIKWSLERMGDVADPSYKQDLEMEELRSRIIKVMHEIIKKELTQRQRQCVEMYYFNQMTIYEIAEELEIDTSTVSRHLKRGREKIGGILCYCQKVWNTNEIKSLPVIKNSKTK